LEEVGHTDQSDEEVGEGRGVLLEETNNVLEGLDEDFAEENAGTASVSGSTLI
jgi:hypothetical protein